MSNDPFRDDRAAAHARADQLARENAQLRNDLDAARGGRAPKSGAGPLLLVLVVVMAVMAAGGAAFLLMARGNRAGFARNGLRITVQWRQENTGARGAIRAVSSDGQAAYAVGDGGMILYRDGAGQWTAQASGVSATLRGVVQRSGEVFAVGDGGTVARFDGASRRWVTEPSGTQADLLAVAATHDGVVAAGANGTILVRRNGAWAAAQSGTQATLRALSASPYNESVFAVGDAGTVLAFVSDGSGWRWVAQASNTQEDLRAVTSDGSDVVAVGAHGTVIRTSLNTPAPWSVARVGDGAGLDAVIAANVSYEFHQENYMSSGSRSMLMALGERGATMVYFDPASTGAPGTAGWYAVGSPGPTTVLAATAVAGGNVLAVGESGAAWVAAQP